MILGAAEATAMIQVVHGKSEAAHRILPTTPAVHRISNISIQRSGRLKGPHSASAALRVGVTNPSLSSSRRGSVGMEPASGL